MSIEKNKQTNQPILEGTDNWSVPNYIKSNELFVEVGSGTIIDALKKLDENMKKKGLGHLISKKPVRSILGSKVQTGQIGCWDRNGKPVVSIKPGSYWNWSLIHEWRGSFELTSQINFLGLTLGQVGQSEAMVVLDPQNRVFIVRNGGFVAFGAMGNNQVIFRSISSRCCGGYFGFRKRKCLG